MNWYHHVKHEAALHADWWKQFGYHFQNVLDHFFPGRTENCQERPPKTDQPPLLCSNFGGTGKPFLEMFFDSRLMISFNVSYNGSLYKCEVQLYMDQNVRAQYQNGLNVQVDENFSGAFEAVSLHVYTYKEPRKCTTLIHPSFMEPMSPYKIIQTIYNTIMGDGGSGDEVEPENPIPSTWTPTPSNTMEPDLVGV